MAGSPLLGFLLASLALAAREKSSRVGTTSHFMDGTTSGSLMRVGAVFDGDHLNVNTAKD
jgi:hypothetical protein